MNRIYKLPQRLGVFRLYCNPKIKHVNVSSYSTINSIEDYDTIYKLPYILPLSLINRSKYYQSVLTATSLPLSSLLNQIGVLDIEIVKLVALVGITGCITLYSFGYLTTNLVGFIYFNEEKNIIRIAYIDFWGRRKDLLSAPYDFKLGIKSDIKPSILGTPLVKLSTGEKFKINFPLGMILDENLYELLSTK